MLYSRTEFHRYSDYIHHQARGTVRLQSDGAYMHQELAVSLQRHKNEGQSFGSWRDQIYLA
jgi:hypothetical protein